MEMRIVVPEAVSTSVLAERLTAAFGPEQLPHPQLYRHRSAPAQDGRRSPVRGLSELLS
jgi:hypothetical protein